MAKANASFLLLAAGLKSRPFKTSSFSTDSKKNTSAGSGLSVEFFSSESSWGGPCKAAEDGCELALIGEVY